MNESIMVTIKRMLGLDPKYAPFDTEIIVHINTALMILKQLGVVKRTFVTSNLGDTWDEVLGYTEDLEGVKTYVYLKVKTLFDPPTSSAVLEAMKANIAELEWRLNVLCD